jgi:cytochrome P450
MRGRQRPAGQPVDLHAEMVRYAMRNVGRILFGDEMEHAATVFGEAFPMLSEHAFRAGFSPVPRSWPTPANRRAERARRRVRAIAEDLLRRRQDSAGSGGSARDLLSALLLARDPDTGDGLADDEIVDQVLTFLAAGHETTATALTFALHLLGQHPSAQQRAHEEVSHVLGDRLPEAADIPALHYTTQVVKEAMRLYPPAYVVGRRVADGDEIQGRHIEPGSLVIASQWATHRHPDFWPEPERFDPDRFEPDAEARRHRFAYFPFGVGMRACIGAQFALVESVVGVAVTVRKYHLTPGVDRVPLATAITLRPRAPVWCRVESRG